MAGNKTLNSTGEDSTATVELIALGAITFLSSLGNLLVLAVIYKSRRTQWLTNMFVAHLAAVNLTVPFICAPVYFQWFSERTLLLGSAGCKSVQLCTFINSTVSAGMLASMALDRYYVVSHPLSVHMGRSQTYQIIALVWIMSIFATSPILYFYEVVETSTGELCLAGTNVRSWRGYMVCFTVVVFLVPLCAMYALHARVLLNIHSRNVGTQHGNNVLGKVPRTKQKVVRMLIFQSIVFACCWLPYYAVSSSSSMEKESHSTIVIVLLLGWSNSALNPLIYASWNGNFRRGCTNLLGVQVSKPYAIAKVISRKHQVDVFESGRHDSIVRGINLMRVRGSLTNSYLGRCDQKYNANVAQLFQADMVKQDMAWSEVRGCSPETTSPTLESNT